MTNSIVHKIQSCGGIDNVNRPSRVADTRFQDLLNVDVSDAGSIYRRMGGAELRSGTAHSIWSDGQDILFVEGTNLLRLETDNSATILRSNLTSADIMRYFTIDGRTYFSNGYDLGVYQNRVARTWGLPIPNNPVVSATVGDLLGGKYGVCLTFMRSDGQESGASVPVYVDAPEGGYTISIAASSESDVAGICVYATTTDGEIFWRQGILGNANATFTVKGGIIADGLPLATANMSAPPPSTAISFYRGRLFLSSGSTIWHTEPWMYELVSMDRNFMFFDSEITLLGCVENGIWVGTKEMSAFLSGTDPLADGGMQIKTKTENGCIEGASVVVSGSVMGRDGVANGPVVIWAGKNGIFAGDSNGQFIDLTSGYFVPPDVDEGWACYEKAEDASRVIFGFKTRTGYGNPVVEISSTGTGTP